MLDRMEQKFGRLAIPGLITFVAAGQAMFWALAIARPGIQGLLLLDTWAVGHGQWWRLFTFVFYPPTGLLGLFSIYWLYMLGQGLEKVWGSFKLNVFYLCGLAAQIAVGVWFGGGITPFALHLTLLLAFADLYPDLEILLMFVLPVKMRWIAWATGAWLLYMALTGGRLAAVQVALSLANYLLFFGPQMVRRLRLQKDVLENRAVFARAEQEVFKMPRKICSQCAVSADSGADIRLCTCEACGADGKFWCEEHLRPHLKEKRPVKI